jgi:hypothetical protein
VDEPALKEVLAPFRDGGCPEQLLLLALKCSQRRAKVRSDEGGAAILHCHA